MTKMGYYFNQANCIGCRACQIACKDKNDLPVHIVFRRVADFEVGAFPNSRIYHYSATCNHCRKPACVDACPSGANYISESDGTVQHDMGKCIGCQYCVNACPYGNPQYVEAKKKVEKCDACIQLRTAGEKPACVAACATRALEFGPFDELAEKHSDAVDSIAILPATTTQPCTLISPHDAANEAGFTHIRL